MDALIQALLLELQEMILREWFAVKIKEHRKLGWEEVYNEFN